MKIIIKAAFLFIGLGTILASCKKEAAAYVVEANSSTMVDVSYGSDAKQKMDIYLPANRTSNTGVIILVHGGTSIGGDKSDLTSQAKYLVASGYAVLNVNYRLVDAAGVLTSANPPHVESLIKIKDQVADMSSIVDHAIINAKTWVVNANRIVMVGHSAGANISLLYSYGMKNTNKVKAVANLAGPVDFVFTDIPNWQYFPPSILELGFRYTGFVVDAANEQHFKDISPLYVANAERKVPTLNVMPQNNNVLGLPKLDVATYQKFTAKLKELSIPNEYYFVAGADHSFNQTGKWILVLDRAVSFFNKTLP